MVGLFKALPALLFATLAAAADFQITQPSASIWWVAKSTNVMTWDCQKSPVSNFTVLIDNTNHNLLLGPLAFIAIQNNFDCSVTVTDSQVSQPPGTGYTLSFANPLNNTDVYTVSQEFEIKPLGSLYPSQVSSSASVASGTQSGTSASASASATSGAFSVHSPSFIGATGVMGLLVAGMLGA